MEHYFSKHQKSKLSIKKISINLKERKFDLYSAAGVFSKEKVDKGSALLIENAIIKDEWKILDLGCGIGVVGISLKLKFPKIHVLLSDINKRAVMLVKRNIKLHKLTDTKTIQSDIFEKIETKFDSILLNPPQTAGKDICFRMIDESILHLEEEGLFQLVARHNKGGKTYSKRMCEIFGNVEEIAKGSGFRIYVSKKSK